MDIHVKSETSKNSPSVGQKRGRITDIPPCFVCGEKASGFHYGVNSCEACKAFFYRNFKRAKEIACEGEDNCQPEPGFGYRCAACRMKKCIELGMSLAGIKKGRYTFERKSQLKKAMDKRKGNQDSNTSPPSQGTSPDSAFPQFVYSVDEAVSAKNKSNTIVKNRNEASTSSPAPMEDNSLATCSGHVDEIPSPTNKLTEPLSQDEITAIIRQVSELYERYPQYSPEYFTKVKNIQQRYLEKEQEKRKIFGKLDPLPVDEFLEIYHKTGIDADGRLATMKAYYPAFEEACQKYVQYAQELPGFDKLGKEDQISMLKGAKASFWMLSDYVSVDVENCLYTCQNYVTVNREEISFFFSETYAENLFAIAEKLQKLHLTQDEVNTMRAYVIFNPDFCETEEGKIHTEIQRSILSQVLEYLLKKYHHSDICVGKELKEIEEKLLELNNENTTQWIFLWTRYQPIIREKHGDPVNMPVMNALFECQKYF